MSIELARSYLDTLGLSNRILEFSVSSATVSLAARALGCEPSRIAKTLSFAYKSDCLLIIAAGDARIDNVRFRTQFGCKARMLDAEDVLRFTGHAVGGVCPFGIDPAIPVYVDRSLLRFDTIYPACGSSNSAIPLSCDELYRSANALGWVDICKNWQNNE